MHIYITDRTGRKFWNTRVAAGFAAGERNNLARHLAMIQARRPAYDKCGVHPTSAHIVEEMEDHEKIEQMSDDVLLQELFA